MVVLNFVILAILIDFLVSVTLIPPALRGTNWEATWRAVVADLAAAPAWYLFGPAGTVDKAPHPQNVV